MFAYNEVVTVTLASGLAQPGGAVFTGFTSHFKTSDGLAYPARPRTRHWMKPDAAGASRRSTCAPSAAAVAVHPQDYVTFPDDFPAYTITVPASGTAPGLLFMAPFPVPGLARDDPLSVHCR